uniref:SNF2 domain-containing protein CLASSY 2 n=1 Tax=Populus trichocarpa TaxID=3694 RepID=A0A2K1ZDB9_POPTR|eukprot:XP_024462866.1 SNF2 domain-containing protein CLASSY 2 isoform X2 [Populus trichocarpa]
MKRKRLHQSKHPFNAHPFEALCCGSWQSVELIQIRDGAMTVHFVDGHHRIEEKGPFSNVRVKSRKATSSDCTCFLRPGIDVCVLSSSERAKNTGEGNSEPVWVDAKISSIKRKPHVSHCSCQFFVNLYVNQGPLGSERARLSKETEAVGINEISVLQKLDNDPCEADNNQQEAQFYRWEFCEDCSLVQRSKLFLGRFSADLTWLLVASVLKQVEFDVRSVQNKIVYQILGGENEHCSLKSNNHINCVTFKVKDSISTPFVVQLVPTDACSEAGHISDTNGTKQSPCYDVMSLRRSKRRNVQPERFLACDAPAETEIGWVRSLPYTPLKWKAEEEEEEEMHLPLAYLFGTHAGASCAEEQTCNEVGASSPKLELLEGIPVSRTKTYLKEIKSNVVNRRDHQTEPGEVRAGMAKRRECQKSTMADRIEHQTRLGDAESGMANRKKHGTQIREVKSGVANRREHQDQLAIVPVHTEDVLATFEQFDSPVKTPEPYSQAFIEFPISYYRKKSSPAAHRKNDRDEDLMFGNGWGGKFSTKKVQRARYRSTHLKQDGSCAPMTYKRTALSAGAYNKLISSYMKNIDATIKSKEVPRIIDQWEEFKAKHSSDQKEKMEPSSVKDDGESSETEMLWREMELCLASAYILEDNEALLSTRTTQKNCQHEFKLDEEIGILCQICGFVKTEIKYVSAPFMEHTGWTAESKPQNEEDSELKPDEDEGSSLFGNHTSGEDVPVSEVNDNVWDLIPELRPKLHMHQKKAFEFLWKNTAGSLVPAHMEKTSKKIGGCVVSHTPGAGKTFLIIAFLVSYLKLFPGKRPLVLAPKTTLYTWYKEFIKWEIPVPVHLIHGTRSSRAFKQTPAALRGSGPRPSQDVVHILDCLEKMQKWHAQPSVLVMGYTSFLTLMREDSKYNHRKYMAKVLRESPGMLILDEGHNPRSAKSRLRKVLMKVETDLRILLSGTLFQNNFCEYFNTLTLARPMFIKEVLKALDPKFKRKKKGAQKARHLLESRARKFFIDNIASKINSDEAEEKMQGLNMLRNMTNGFIDVYEGTASDTLPGIQIYTILMNPTDIQHQILVKLHKIMEKCPGYPLEVELLITLASIHPSLVNSSVCVKKFYNLEELMELEKLRFDCKKGSKVMFVLNLVYRVVKNEKVLIFCHNIAPIKLFLELFENIFRWQQGKEILVLTGELELFERGRVMDKFEELGGPSRVLLASITACAEGISLTAASRVILLDSEWNPSKTKQAIARAFRPGQQKMVYVYQLLATGTVEEDKYRRTAWKEWVSRMIFSEEFVEDPSRWQAEKIEDDVLREIVEEDRVKSFHMIMKNEKASTS